MIDLPKGQTTAIDLTKLSGPYVVGWWFDPRTACRNSHQGSFADHRVWNLYTTFQWSGPESDWILVLDSEKGNFSPPETAPSNDKSNAVS